MYKKEKFRDLDKKYNSHLYSGFLGVLMNYCHKKLENFKKKDAYDKILNIILLIHLIMLMKFIKMKKTLKLNLKNMMEINCPTTMIISIGL